MDAVNLKTIRVGDRYKYITYQYVQNTLEITHITNDFIRVVAVGINNIGTEWPIGYKYNYAPERFARECAAMVFVSRAKPESNFKRQLGMRWSHAK